MRRLLRSVPTVAALSLAALSTAPIAHAKVSATAKLESNGTGVRAVVTLRSTKAWTPRTTPRSLTLTAGGKRFAFGKRKSVRAAKAASQTWASRYLTGAALEPLSKSVDKRVAIVVRSRSGKATFKPKLAPAPPFSQTPGPGQTPSPTPTPTPTPTNPGATEPDAKTRFITLLTSHGYNAPCVGQACGQDLMNFCADGRFADRWTSGNTGQDYHYNGTWQLASEVVAGNYMGYPVVEARVIAQTTDQFGEAKTFDWVVDLSEQYPSGFFGGQEFARTSTAC